MHPRPRATPRLAAIPCMRVLPQCRSINWMRATTLSMAMGLHRAQVHAGPRDLAIRACSPRGSPRWSPPRSSHSRALTSAHSSRSAAAVASVVGASDSLLWGGASAWWTMEAWKTLVPAPITGAVVWAGVMFPRPVQIAVGLDLGQLASALISVPTQGLLVAGATDTDRGRVGACLHMTDPYQMMTVWVLVALRPPCTCRPPRAPRSPPARSSAQVRPQARLVAAGDRWSPAAQSAIQIQSTIV